MTDAEFRRTDKSYSILSIWRSHVDFHHYWRNATFFLNKIFTNFWKYMKTREKYRSRWDYNSCLNHLDVNNPMSFKMWVRVPSAAIFFCVFSSIFKFVKVIQNCACEIIGNATYWWFSKFYVYERKRGHETFYQIYSQRQFSTSALTLWLSPPLCITIGVKNTFIILCVFDTVDFT